MPRRFHSGGQFRAPMFREPALENFHERFLFRDGQPVGGIQNLREFCHGQNLAPNRVFENDDFLHAATGGNTVSCAQPKSFFALMISKIGAGISLL